MAPGLCLRIIERLEELNLLQKDDVILDFFGGVGTTGLAAAVKGYSSIMVELEKKFCDLSQRNKEHLERRLKKKIDMKIIQGDSRNLTTLLNREGFCSIVSPPYSDQNKKSDLTSRLGQLARTKRTGIGKQAAQGKATWHYSDNPENIGNLEDRPLVGLTSPPYADMVGQPGGKPPKHVGISTKTLRKYSDDPNNIGNLEDPPLVGITSPPYGSGEGTGHSSKSERDRKFRAEKRLPREYGNSPGQIGNLNYVGVTSPPYLKAQSGGGIAKEGYNGKYVSKQGRNQPRKIGDRCGYSNKVSGDSEGQIANLPESRSQKRETYLEALLKVFQEASKCCKVLVTVTKNPTRKGKLRRLDLDIKNLLELCQFRIIEYHRAILFREVEEETLFGETIKKAKGRLGFFKRRHHSKGLPVARWEDIFISVRRGAFPQFD